MIPMSFVSPTGTFYECDYQGHSVLADKLCDSFTKTNCTLEDLLGDKYLI